MLRVVAFSLVQFQGLIVRVVAAKLLTLLAVFVAMLEQHHALLAPT